jgi:pSer/pThr/pTyr-binding forkhead associated (FHA) protein
MWKLSIEDDEGNRTVVSLVRDEYSIGRAEDNTVRLTERNISRRHARLRRDSSTWLLEDANSYNGLFVNGARVGSVQRLLHGDLVEIGDYKLIVIDEAQVAENSEDGTSPTTPVGPPILPLLDQPDRLVMLVGPTPGVEFPLVGARMIIGRGEDCDIALNHSSVSRIHAEIQALQDGRYEMIDRGSANGVRVNGVELDRALLDSRDTVELGDVVLKFIPAGDIYRFEADESHRFALHAAAAGSSTRWARDGKRGLSIAAKLGMGLLVLGVAGAVGAFALGLHPEFGTDQPRSGHATVSERGDRAARILALAVSQLEQGQVAAAHGTASQLPADSNARQSGGFRRIEAAWADMMFERAAAHEDRAQARELLDRIAKTPSVDTVRRRRAADQVARLDAKGLDVTELPRQSAQTRFPSPQQPNEPSGFEAPKTASRAPMHAATPAARSSLVPGGSTRTPPAIASSVPPTQMVASGNLEELTAAKESLKAKAKSGAATQQDKKLLTALCRQLGDTSCAR